MPCSLHVSWWAEQLTLTWNLAELHCCAMNCIRRPQSKAYTDPTYRIHKFLPLHLILQFRKLLCGFGYIAGWRPLVHVAIILSVPLFLGSALLNKAATPSRESETHRHTPNSCYIQCISVKILMVCVCVCRLSIYPRPGSTDYSFITFDCFRRPWERLICLSTIN